jgi:hypothetical protein
MTATTSSMTAASWMIVVSAATTAMAPLSFVIIIISTAATVVGFACTLGHIWTPILLEFPLGFLEPLLGLLPLLRRICVPHSSTVVVDLGQILTELLAMRAVALLAFVSPTLVSTTPTLVSPASAAAMMAAAWMIVTLSYYVSVDKAFIGKAERQTSPILSCSFSFKCGNGLLI